MNKVLRLIHVRNRCDYMWGVQKMKQVQEELMQGLSKENGDQPSTTMDTLVLMEHFPVYTLGRNADESNVLFDKNDTSYKLYRVERGGEVTYHGPGQIVGYPVFDLRRHKRDLHWFLRQVEESIIQVLGKYGQHGDRKTEYTGVWVGNTKVAAIGLNASKWITSHGFALNVSTDLTAFDKIIPCGIDEKGTGVTSLEKLTDQKFTRLQVQQEIVRQFTNVFQFDHTIINEI